MPPVSPLAAEVLHTFSTFLSGFKYGTKIRLPHATIMTLIFQRHLPPREQARRIYRAVLTHAYNLGLFAMIYKAALLALKHTTVRSGHLLQPSETGRPFRPMHAAAAGAIGGWCVWGKYEHVNYQIVLYLMSRVAVSLAQSLARHDVKPFNSPKLKFENSYPVLATVTWAGVMYLYENEPDQLQKSLTRSMDEIYHSTEIDGAVDALLKFT